LLKIDNKISPLPLWRYINPYVHLRNFNKQHLILKKFYVSNATSVSNQQAKFQLNFTTQTIARVAFVRSPQNVDHPQQFV